MTNECNTSFVLTEEAIAVYLDGVRRAGVAESAVRKYRSTLKDLYRWLDGEKLVTATRLLDWRKSIESRGYAAKTVWNYIVCINSFLRTGGYESLCIPRPVKDIAGQSFGYLTAIEPIGKNSRRNVIWKCRCKCGKEINVPTTLLVNMNTTSCGCLKVDKLQNANRYVDGTGLRQALKNDPLSERTVSGYTGVYPRGGKWMARITYKGKLYHLGTYSRLEDAIKARARAKELVMEDAKALYAATDHLFATVPARPKKPEKRKTALQR